MGLGGALARTGACACVSDTNANTTPIVPKFDGTAMSAAAVRPQIPVVRVKTVLWSIRAARRSRAIRLKK